MRYVIFLSLLSIAACISPEETTDFETDLISMEKVVDSVFAAANMDSLRYVTKTIRVNQGQPEIKNLDNYNIKQDLDQLKDYDVATPRWADFIDTAVKDSAGYHQIIYTTENERAPIRYIKIVKEGDAIQSIEMVSQKETLISDQEMKIKWNFDQEYMIENSSRLLFRDPSIFRMHVNY